MFRRSFNLSFLIYFLLNITIYLLYPNQINFKNNLFIVNTIHGIGSFFILYYFVQKSELRLPEFISIIIVYNIVLTISFYLLFITYTGKPFEFNPSDSLLYHHLGRLLKNRTSSWILRYVSNELAIGEFGFVFKRVFLLQWGL